MSIIIEKFTISTKGFDDFIDVTDKINTIVACSSIKKGLANISVSAATASLITVENEPGIAIDLPRLLDTIVPVNRVYQHDNMWHEGNAFAHLKSALLGTNITVPIVSGEIELTNWQRIVLIDFDNKPRIRQIVVGISF